MSGFKDRHFYWNMFSSQGSPRSDWYNGENRLNLSFDADVSNLKKGNVLDIAHINVINKTTGQDTTLAGIIYPDGLPLMVNGKEYGRLMCKIHSNHYGNSHWHPSQNFAIGDYYDIYAVITEDVPGVGNQHFEFKDLGNATINYVAQPVWWSGHDSLTFKMQAVEAGTNRQIGTETDIATKVSQGAENKLYSSGFEMHPEDDTYQAFWSRLFDRRELFHSQDDFDTWRNSNYKNGTHIQDYYWVNERITNSTGFANYADQLTIYDTNNIQPEIQVANSNGDFTDLVDVNSVSRGGNWRNQSNSKSNIYLADGLSLSELQAKALDYAKQHPELMVDTKDQLVNSLSFFSKQNDKTYLMTTIASKAAMQKVLSLMLTSETNRGDYKYTWDQDLWNIQNDRDPAKAKQNTQWYLGLPSMGAMTQWYTWADIHFHYGDPTVDNKITVEQLDNNGNVLLKQESTSSPYQQMHAGQSGIKVHYIDGSTGQEMTKFNWSVGNVGDNLSVKPQGKLGYSLTTENAKGIPSGAQTIETDTDIKYPSEGTWKNVYVVYMPYSTGHTEAHYHYNTVITSTSLTSLPI